MKDGVYRVAGYAKLAKLWERSREQAVSYHVSYYTRKYKENTRMQLAGVYVDITGQKEICRRPEMLRLLRDCTENRVDCIASQTKGYLAANSGELCYFLKYLFDLPNRIEIITEDDKYQIDTVRDAENQRQALKKMAEDYVLLEPAAYEKWKDKIVRNMGIG